MLFELFAYSQDSDDPIDDTGLRKVLPVRLSTMRVEMAMRELEKQDFVYHGASEYEAHGYTILRKGYMNVEQELSEPSSFMSRYARDKEGTLAVSTLNLVPASDRIVTRKDNLPAIEEIETRLAKLEDEILKSNSVEELLEEPKAAILAELDAGEAMVQGEAFRLNKLIGLIVPLLKKLADKFASGAIGKLAGELIEALLKLVG